MSPARRGRLRYRPGGTTVAQGVGAALLEQILYDDDACDDDACDDDAQLRTGPFADYMIPAAFAGTDLEIVHREPPSPLAEGVCKGMGERGAIGAPAAIVGAVADALDIDGIELPITPERVPGLLSGQEFPADGRSVDRRVSRDQFAAEFADVLDACDEDEGEDAADG